MTTLDIKDFFTKYLKINSALMPEEFRLRSRELDFLVECCVFNFNGGNVSDIKALKQYMTDIKFFSDDHHVSIYKNKIGIKKWAITGVGTFKLPGLLGTRDPEKLKFNLLLEFKHERVQD